MERFVPGYLQIEAGVFQRRIRTLREIASPCGLCPRRCGSLRGEGEEGYCRTGFGPFVSSVHPHHGEEAPLTGAGGSGAIFLAGCNLGCIFCQNYDISHLGGGRMITVKALAEAMLSLQHAGCHNINFVSPSHQVHSIVEAVMLAAGAGLTVPLVYNTGSYDSAETLRLLDGIFDIYMPDLKFTDSKTALKLAGAADYPDVARQAIREMHRQVGDLVTDERGVALRGLLVRHLVLPHDLAGSGEAFRFLAEEISVNTYLNVMGQYRPCFESAGQPGIGDSLSRSDYLNVLELALKWGLRRLD
ncbi:MAG: radical SAM protein [bacterium]|nr:radical SAM protein [bacterium]MDT8395102.1 radical SAM protein [bacterium]